MKHFTNNQLKVGLIQLFAYNEFFQVYFVHVCCAVKFLNLLFKVHDSPNKKFPEDLLNQHLSKKIIGNKEKYQLSIIYNVISSSYNKTYINSFALGNLTQSAFKMNCHFRKSDSVSIMQEMKIC